MGFNLMGGLNAMGGAVAQTAGVAALEIQRSELEKQKMSLADMLAEGRENRVMDKKAAIDNAAAVEDRDWRAGQSLLNRGHEVALADKREAGDNARTKMSNDRMAASESAAQRRFDAEMEFRKEQVKETAKDKKEERILSSAIAASTSTQEEPYTTADGERATRPVKVFNPAKAAALLRDAGHEDLATMFAKKPPAKGANVTGKPRPPLESFMDHGGD